MKDLDHIVASFSEKFGVLFRPASPTEISSAESAGLPRVLLEFYEEYEPNELGQEKVRFFPLEKVVANLTDFVPGCHLSRYGYFAICGTDHGDAFFVRPKGASHYTKLPVYLFSHEIDFRNISAHQVEEFAVRVADGIPDFLTRAIEGRLVTEPD